MLAHLAYQRSKLYRPQPRPAESLGFGISGPNCNAEFAAGCADAMCNGTGTCVANPASFDNYPAGSNTNICFAGLTDDFCGSWACDGDGGCTVTQREGLAPGDTTPECGGRPRGSPPDTDCFHDGCVNGACVADLADSRLCPRPAGCSAPFVCSLFPVSDDPDVLAGCAPTTECYLGGTRDGSFDGECSPAGTVDDTCLFCDPSTQPFSRRNRPLGSSCDDQNRCTVADVCGLGGDCVGECIPGCGDDEFCGAGG